MFSHAHIWSAIDALAKNAGLTPSGLARRAGLDPTSFNKSKRFAADGRPRWPSTESLSKILTATSTSFEAFAVLLRTASRAEAGAPATNDRTGDRAGNEE